MDFRKNTSYWILISVSILLTFFLLIGQTYSLINYDSAVKHGLQESVEEIGNVGIAFAKGFAFGDTLIYIPLLIVGITGFLKKKKWGFFSLFGSLAISVYWPLVHLYAIFIERDAINLASEKYISYPIVLSLIIIYGIWGMIYLYKNQKSLIS